MLLDPVLASLRQCVESVGQVQSTLPLVFENAQLRQCSVATHGSFAAQSKRLRLPNTQDIYNIRGTMWQEEWMVGMRKHTVVGTSGVRKHGQFENRKVRHGGVHGRAVHESPVGAGDI
jgi:hypothetical protein